MADYISREAVMGAFARKVKRSNNSDFVPAPTWNNAVEIVEQFPAADVQPIVHAHWEEKIIDDTNPFFRRRFYCSACRDWQTYGETRHCPTCGARMDEVIDDA